MSLSLRIGTRASHLALCQAREVAALLCSVDPSLACEIVPFHTKGDALLHRPLYEAGNKGLFVTELEEALLGGEIDLAVHSAKDLPERLADGLQLLGVPARKDPRDVLLLRRDLSGLTGAAEAEALSFLPAQSLCIGTASLRRQREITRLLPQAHCALLRGNLDTRLQRLAEGAYDGIILAAAGLQRAGFWEDPRFLSFPLEPTLMLPAAGQGALAIEGKAMQPAASLCQRITHPESLLCLETERHALSCLGANCSEAVGVYASLTDSVLSLSLFYGNGTRQTGQAPIADRLLLAARLAEQALAEGSGL